MSQVALTAVAVNVGIPGGYEALGEALPLSMLPTVSWLIVEAYDQRAGRYGLLIYDAQGVAVSFLSTNQEIDALCALVEFCVDLLSYWPLTEDGLLEQWRSIWWMAQTLMVHQRLRLGEQA